MGKYVWRYGLSEQSQNLGSKRLVSVRLLQHPQIRLALVKQAGVEPCKQATQWVRNSVRE